MDLFSDAEGSSGSRSPNIIEAHSSDEDESGGLRTNNEYAARFQHNKERVELQRLQEKHGNGKEEEDDGSSSSEESEDDDGEQMTADVDAAILSTLAKIRRKDESIYQVGKRVFDEERQVASQSKLLPRRLRTAEKDGKKVTLAHYQRARIQELLKTSDDPAKALAEATMIERRSDHPSYGDDAEEDIVPHTKEQEMLRKNVIDALQNGEEDEDDEDDDMFTLKPGERQTDGGDIENDPESYKRYLMDVLGGREKEIREILRTQTEEAARGDEEVDMLTREKAQKDGIRMNTDGTEKENEDFLVNYVLNRGWVDNPSAAPKASRKRETDEQSEGDESDAASSEDSFDSRADAYETAYNFRFQELEDGKVNPQIQSYARQIEGSVRRKENKRKLEREERARRKEQEKEKKRGELNRMRDLKRKSIVDRLKTLKEATGSTAVSFDQLDLDAEFDPAEHDRLMAEAFNEDYYGGEGDDVKPKWADDDDDDVDITEILRENEEGEAKPKKGSKAAKAGKKAKASAFVTDDGEQIEMDADAEEGEPDDSGKKLTKAEKKKLKKREKAKARKAQATGEGENEDVEMDADAPHLAQVDEDAADMQGLSREERKKKMEHMMNEYYGLEYEDMIGDQPTRFKYTEVSRSDYGLTPVEILLADDNELNKVVGLKRLQPYRQGNSKRGPADLKTRLKEFRRDFYRGDRKAMVEALGEGYVHGDAQIKVKKAGKRERERKKAAAAAAAAADAGSDAAEPSPVDGDAKEAEHKAKKEKKEEKKRRREGEEAEGEKQSEPKNKKKSKKRAESEIAT